MSVVFNLRKQGDYCLKGDKGDKGDRGEQGIQGIRGEKGLQGIQGIQGIRGLTGERGPQGLQGIQGIQGKQGIQGEKGDRGEQGIQGEKGDPGNTENSLSKRNVVNLSVFDTTLPIGMYSVIPDQALILNTGEIIDYFSATLQEPPINMYFQGLVFYSTADMVLQVLTDASNGDIYTRECNYSTGINQGWKRLAFEGGRVEFSEVVSNKFKFKNSSGELPLFVAQDGTISVKTVEEYRTFLNVPSKVETSSTINETNIGDIGNNATITAQRNMLYSIGGDKVVEISTIDTSQLQNGDSIFFACLTNSQVANIKFNRGGQGYFTPKGQDFWITGSDNGDVIFEMLFFGGSLRFKGI